MDIPECGSYSNLHCGKECNRVTNKGDIPDFIKLVQILKPQFFVMDNLPKCLLGVTIEDWILELGDIYHLFPEWISNYHYGNTQINRRRFFMIGALKKYNFVFKPGEFMHDKRLNNVIADLPKGHNITRFNHVHVPNDQIIKGWHSYNFDLYKHYPDKHITLKEFKTAIMNYPPKKNFAYINKKGEAKLRPGYSKIVLYNYSPVLSGGGSARDDHYRADTLNPLTIREKARIQGCPDDFIFYPLNYMDDDKDYVKVTKQVGKFMPVEFNRFIADQIKWHLYDYYNPTYDIRSKMEFYANGNRLIKPNPYIDEAKIKCCNRTTHCEYCWLYPCKLKQLKEI